MSGTFDGASTKKRTSKLGGGSQKYWQLFTTRSSQNSKNDANAIHPSNSTFSERFRDDESFLNLLSDLQDGSSRLNKAIHVKRDMHSNHFDDFFDELATKLAQKRRANGRIARFDNKEVGQVAAVLPPCQSCLEWEESKSSRDLGAKRKAQIVTAKLQKEFPTFQNPMTPASSVSEMMEPSEFDPLHDYFIGNVTRISSRRKSIARARRSSAEEDRSSPDSSENSNSTTRRPSRACTRKQTSRTRATKSYQEEHQKTKRTIPLQAHQRASVYLPRPHPAITGISTSCELQSPSRLVKAPAARRIKDPELDLAVDADRISFSNSKKRNPSKLATAFRQNTTPKSPDHLPKNRGSLQGTSPCRRRASVVNASCHNSLQHSERNLPLPHRARVKSDRLSQSEHFPSPATMRGSCRKLKCLFQEIEANDQPPHVATHSAKSESAMQRSAPFEKITSLFASLDNSNPFSDTAMLFDEVSFEDVLFDKPDLQANGCFRLPEPRQSPETGRFAHSKDTQDVTSTHSNVSPCTPVTRRLMRRAQALSAMQLALHV
jgi:hypothetical protein